MQLPKKDLNKEALLESGVALAVQRGRVTDVTSVTMLTTFKGSWGCESRWRGSGKF